MRELLTELLRVIGQGLSCVYCSVVATRGSTPQKAGAAMLVYPDGRQSGTLGGGCVEAEVRRRALAGLAESQSQPAIHTFTLDDDFGWDDGLICGGRMTILADPVTGSAADYYRRLDELLTAGLGFTQVVALPENNAGLLAGSRLLFDSHNNLTASRAAEDVADLGSLLAPITSRPKCQVQKGLAILLTPPRVCLWIIGAGHVGQAVAALAAEVDFDVWVLDDRETYANAERFPMARRHIVGDIGQTLKEMKTQVNPSTYCLIVTRGHDHDEEALYHLATAPAGYVGMIGSKRKIRVIFEDLRTKGIPDEALARVHAPIGIPIGSQTVPEIAISVVAELIACRNLDR